ncbi:hypothetical protein [Tropicimonas sp. S265A]|uniref:hypothetical protein n=1 Tax=Tropicimonas sp. S265A TaxID=3415134 RepID=UPI003C7B0593
MIEVPAHEKDRVRVFAVNGDQNLSGVRQTFLSQLDSSAKRPPPGYISDLLGTPDVDPSHVELFPASDVAELGLTAYLQQALDVTEDSVIADRGKLDALQGYVLLVLSAAFAGRAVQLRPGPDLTLIGTYPTAPLTQPGAKPLPTPERANMPPPDRAPPVQSARLGTGTIAVVVVVALIIAAALVLAVSGGST